MTTDNRRKKHAIKSSVVVTMLLSLVPLYLLVQRLNNIQSWVPFSECETDTDRNTSAMRYALQPFGSCVRCAAIETPKSRAQIGGLDVPRDTHYGNTPPRAPDNLSLRVSMIMHAKVQFDGFG